jgi:peptidoglycan/xylan/chitin deacetylase (PgdA/CDA1 family)
MKTGLVIPAGIIFLMSVTCFTSRASKLPTSPATPTGCASGGFDVGIEASREWGVVPFRAAFTVHVSGPADSVETVYWSFGAEGPVEDAGGRISHVFSEPIDYEVIARVVTKDHGVETRSITVSGYSAVMTLTFDDGHKTVLTDALPLLSAYSVTATAYIVPAWTSLDPDAYMTWNDVALLQSAGWDIGSHGMTHARLTEIDPFDLHYEIGQSQTEFRSRGFPAKTFSLPNESHNDTVLDVVRQYYESCKTDRGINPGINDTDPFMIQSQVSHSWLPFTFYEAHIDSVLGTGGWYVLNNHILKDDCTGTTWCVSAARIAEVIEYARANRVKIANVGEVMDNRTAGYSLGEDGMATGAPAPPEGREGQVPPGGPAVVVLSAAVRLHDSPAHVRYSLARQGNLDIGVYDVTGRRIRSLLTAGQSEGEHAVSWDGRNASGNRVGSGFYFVVFTLDGGMAATARVVVLR